VAELGRGNRAFFIIIKGSHNEGRLIQTKHEKQNPKRGQWGGTTEGLGGSSRSENGAGKRGATKEGRHRSGKGRPTKQGDAEKVHSIHALPHL